MKKKRRGFTMIELVVVMVIVGILAVVAVPMYRNYVNRAYSTEGSALIGSIASSQKVHLAEFGNFYDMGVAASSNATLGIDATMNRYFRTFLTQDTDGGAGYTAVATGSGDAAGINVEIDQDPGAAPVMTINGL
ncbi:type IV pilin protein [Elusimicrobiota bacterium]